MKRRIQTGGFLKPCTHVYLATILYVRREKILGQKYFWDGFWDETLGFKICLEIVNYFRSKEYNGGKEIYEFHCWTGRKGNEGTFFKCLKISRLLCHETRRVSNKTKHTDFFEAKH